MSSPGADTDHSHDLADKVVLVTGGSRGIGRAIVLGAVARGARVAFCARSLGAAARQVCTEAERVGGSGSVLPVGADVTRADDIDAFFDKVIAAYGGVDVVVNNAAINIDALLVQMSLADFDAVLFTNLTAPFLLAKRAVREFLAAEDGGTVINIGSIFDRGATSQVAYATSKGGLRGLTRAIAEEYGEAGVRAGLVVSGFVETELSMHMPERYRREVLQNPLSRAGDPEEVASVVLFLACGSACVANGGAVYASGGIVEANIVG